MHMCNDTIASRGPYEVESCILKHLEEIVMLLISSSTVMRVCGGQNRNIYLVCLWLHIISSSVYSIMKIDHKFMIFGHSYLPNDRDFGHVEQS